MPLDLADLSPENNFLNKSFKSGENNFYFSTQYNSCHNIQRKIYSTCLPIKVSCHFTIRNCLKETFNY